MAQNLHGLLRGTGKLSGFLHNIELPNTDEIMLCEARDAIRAELRDTFQVISNEAPMQKAFLIEGSLRAYITDSDLKALQIAPKFRSQGSYVYKTLNDPVPQHAPPQQVDLDDGVFVPTSFVNEEQPVIAAKAYFEAVEGALRPLCQRKGWRLSQKKPSCVRIYVGTKIHIDLPLYAIPDEDFAQVEMMAKADGSRTMRMDASVLVEAEYQKLPDDHIMLAERGGTWRKSDPRALERWFQAAVWNHGEELRHVCRYLKAWRDHQWREPKDGIPSITLMAMAVGMFDAAPSKPPADREDLALQLVAAGMPALLEKTIKNPVVEGETLDGGWTREMRADFVSRARELASCIAAAVGGTSPDAAIVRMQGCLGGRVPSQPTLVEPDSQEAAILATPRRYAAAPAVGRSVSG